MPNSKNMKSKIIKVKSDLSGFIFSYIWDVKWGLQMSFYTFIQIFKLFLFKIKHGSKLSFYGITTFKRAALSKISIGDNCTFRSKVDSNLIGRD